MTQTLSQRADREILIVGGGFTGASLACALADGQRKITVLEARPGPRASFAGELIHPTGVEVLGALGLRSVLERAGAVAITGFAVFRAGDSLPSTLAYEGAPGVHTTGLAIDHDRMVAALREEAMARPGVTLRFGARVTALLREGGRVVGVTTEDGGEVRADLVLSAEGRHGRLRGALGIHVDSRLISYTAALRIRGGRLPVAGAGHIFLGAPGPILAYPIGPAEARACFDLPEAVHPAQLAAELRARYLPHLPPTLAAAMDRALDEEPAQLVATHGMRAARTVKDGAALVGDAGGCAHPLTAGGMTLCLNDIRLLREALSAAPGIDAALASYEQQRLPMALTRIALTDALYEIFAGEAPGLRRLREAVFEYWRTPAHRHASMALLAGADVRTSRLALEYARVLGQALRGPDRLPALSAALGQAARTLRTVRPRPLPQ